MSSIEEVVNLIETLYSANPAIDVNQIQQNLQAIQKSNDGIHLANQLLTGASYSNNVKYFGALTLTVQLNLNVESFETFWRLFSSNLVHLIRLCGIYASDTRSNASLMIAIKKLMSNLSLIFITINETEHVTEDNNTQVIKQWNNPINTFIHLFSEYGSKQVLANNWTNVDDPMMAQLLQQSINCDVSYDNLLKFVATSQTFNELTLTFTEIIIEDLTKYQSKKHNVTRVHEMVHERLYISTMALLNINITLELNHIHNITKLQLSDSVFKCTYAWINYISMTRHMSSVTSMSLSEIFQNLMNLMCQSSDQTDNFYIAEKVLSIFGNVFANDPTMMSFDLRQQIEVIFLGISRTSNTNVDTSKNAWMLQYMNYLVTNEMTEELKELAICIVDYLQISNLDVCNKLFSSVHSNDYNISQEYIKVLLQMTNFPLTPVLQEFFSVRMVDFWADLADSYVNLPNEALLPNSTQIGIDIFQQVINIYLPKISLQNKQKIIEEDAQDESAIHEFDDFRSAVIELSQNLWSILGNEHLTNMLVGGIGSSDASTLPEDGKMSVYYQIEAMSFIADALMSDMNLSESPWILNILRKNPYFVRNILLLFQISIQMAVTSKAVSILKINMVRSSSKMIGTLAGYLTSNEADLSQCIQTLFQGLESCSAELSANKDVYDKVEIMIIKTISIICDTCRQQLSVQYLDHFIGVFSSLLQPTATVSGFTRSTLAKSVGYIIECRVQNGPEEQGKYIVQILDMIEDLIDQCLDSPVNIQHERKDYILNLLNCISEFGSAMIHDEDYESTALIQMLQQYHEFWQNDPFQCRVKLLNLIERILGSPVFNKDSSFVEVCCLILGKALTLPDDDPHFLRYSMSDIINVMLKYVQVIELSTSLPYFIYLLERLVIQFKTQFSVEEFDYLFNELFIKYYNALIGRDPDLLQMMINFVITVLDKAPHLVLNSKCLPGFIIPQCLKLLPSNEKFTIVAVTKFWTKLINNRKYSQADLANMQSLIMVQGQELVYQTMYGLYHTQRSDLNSYTDLIRGLVAKFPMETKEWLISALPQICDKPTIHEKFVNRLFVTRGSRAAGNVILTWWLECTALPSY
ncbi:similar to Saccharomyces cerevisiae YGL016W KAP122 Karyopherin beta, responsible for import of the Toa1p-Toa2p complex into the nucleus [Maudiozyma saulgeensis]|uniref:Similar to Saccharomyces cerevisiae YGL016W KAP122 Karyopherin beta, responsible for import of the Toa1p-Toa2p complex into the nucleus n=1 Tax=Maudiozyma saulgeensis TaxID=1789683 RepID=A0A1X7RAQ9_9SACH|nr:similar to Saccharomyces cerevisiae YGL016W KAP122 Karyopherin beta, responsible for import of the Toa1p-Toa2p complex into the nucleus [Kazachstania saulgeensis]